MERDTFGYCLNTDMLDSHCADTFTHIRGYEKNGEHTAVKMAIPQMSGNELKSLLVAKPSLIWRAEYFCRR